MEEGECLLLAQLGLYAVSVPAGAGDCGGVVSVRSAVSLSQDCQDESGRGAEE